MNWSARHDENVFEMWSAAPCEHPLPAMPAGVLARALPAHERALRRKETGAGAGMERRAPGALPGEWAALALAPGAETTWAMIDNDRERSLSNEKGIAMPIDWYTFDDHIEPFATTELKGWGIEPDCPKCGKQTEYQEGQIDENAYTGHAIEGYWFACFSCRVESDIIGTPGDWHDED